MLDTNALLEQVRIWMLGTFRVERRTREGIWQEVSQEEWGTNAHTRHLLQVLWCQGRTARRSTIIEALWEEQEPGRADEYLNKAAMRLRHILYTQKHPDLFQTIRNRSTYQLANQSRIWVDAHAAQVLVQEATRVGLSSPQALSLLQEAHGYLERGIFLEDEDGLWVHGTRGMLEVAAYRCALWLADAYTAQGKLLEAEAIISTRYQRDPTNEALLCRWMTLLHQQGMTHQALRLYKETSRLFVLRGMVLSPRTRAFVEQLRQESSPLVQPLLFSVEEYEEEEACLPNTLTIQPIPQDHVHFLPHRSVRMSS